MREMSGRGLSPDLCCLRLVVVCCPGCLCVSRPSAVGLVWPVLCVLLLLSPVGLWLLAYLCSLVLWWSLGCLCVCSVCVLPVFACVCLCFLSVKKPSNNKRGSSIALDRYGGCSRSMDDLVGIMSRCSCLYPDGRFCLCFSAATEKVDFLTPPESDQSRSSSLWVPCVTLLRGFGGFSGRIGLEKEVSASLSFIYP